jgi:hypothetical protein
MTSLYISLTSQVALAVNIYSYYVSVLLRFLLKNENENIARHDIVELLLK